MYGLRLAGGQPDAVVACPSGEAPQNLGCTVGAVEMLCPPGGRNAGHEPIQRRSHRCRRELVGVDHVDQAPLGEKTGTDQLLLPGPNPWDKQQWLAGLDRFRNGVVTGHPHDAQRSGDEAGDVGPELPDLDIEACGHRMELLLLAGIHERTREDDGAAVERRERERLEKRGEHREPAPAAAGSGEHVASLHVGRGWRRQGGAHVPHVSYGHPQVVPTHAVESVGSTGRAIDKDCVVVALEDLAPGIAPICPHPLGAVVDVTQPEHDLAMRGGSDRLQRRLELPRGPQGELVDDHDRRPECHRSHEGDLRPKVLQLRELYEQRAGVVSRLVPRSGGKLHRVHPWREAEVGLHGRPRDDEACGGGGVHGGQPCSQSQLPSEMPEPNQFVGVE